MARMRFVGSVGSRRHKVVKERLSVQQDTYDEAVVDEVDPNQQFVKKLQKGLKLFREIAGDSDAVSNNCMNVLYTFRAL